MRAPQTRTSRWQHSHKAVLCLLVASALIAPRSNGQGDSAAPQIYPQLGHTDITTALAVTSDGKRVVSGSYDQTVKVWDLESGRLVRTLQDTAGVNAVAITPNGKNVVSGGGYRLGASVDYSGDNGDYIIKVWDIESGRVRQTLHGHTKMIGAVAVTPDGRRVVSGGYDHTVKVWDLESGRLERTLPGHANAVLAVVVTPDGRRVVSRSLDRTIKVWEIESGRVLQTLKSQSQEFSSITVTPDSRRIISAESDVIKFWDIDRGTLVQTWQSGAKKVQEVVVTPDGRHVLSAVETNADYPNNDAIQVWDAASGLVLKTLPSDIWHLAVTPDGSRAISGSAGGTLRVWDIRGGRLVHTLGRGAASIACVAVAPVGEVAASGNYDRAIRVWDTARGRLLRTFRVKEMIRSLAFTPDGRRVVSVSAALLDSGSGTIQIWDIQSGRLVRTLQSQTQEKSEDRGWGAMAVAVTPDGRHVVSSATDTVKVWDIESGRLLRSMRGAAAEGGLVVVTRDGRRVVSGGGGSHGIGLGDAPPDGFTIKVWDIESREPLQTLRVGRSKLTALAVTPDGRHMISATFAGRNEINVWDIESGRFVRALRGHRAYITSVAVTPDGKRIISGSNDATVKVWDFQSGNLLQTLEGHTGLVEDVTVAPDGRRFISAGRDGTIRFWNASSGNYVSHLMGFTDGEWLSVTPEGYYNASPKGDQHLNVRIGGRVYGIDQFRATFYKPLIVETALRLNDSGAAVAGTMGSNAPTISGADEFEPPFVVIKSPDDGQYLNTRAAQLSFVVEDRKQPLKSVRIFVNGAQVAATRGWGTASQIPLGGEARRLEWRTTIPLNVGENLIEVVAANLRSEARSSIHLVVNRGGTPAAGHGGVSLPRLFILAIGVNRTSPLLTELNYAGRDAEAAVLAFRQQAGKLFSEVHALTINDAPSDEIKRVASGDERVQLVNPATRANIIDSLSFLKNAGQYDVAVLFVAGHAIMDGGEYYFMANDSVFRQGGGPPRLRASTAIPWTELKKTLYLPAKALVFLDTCHSEGAIGFTGRSADPEGLVRELQEMRTVLFASSQGKEVSQERPDLRHGVFTFALLEGLGGKADTDSDGVVKMKELDTFVSRRVVELTRGAQHPITLTPDGYVDFPVFKLR